jgi:hypothetical protein
MCLPSCRGIRTNKTAFIIIGINLAGKFATATTWLPKSHVVLDCQKQDTFRSLFDNCKELAITSLPKSVPKTSSEICLPKPVIPPEYVRTICKDFWNWSNQNTVERRKYTSVIIGVHQPIGSNDRCRISSTVGDALTLSAPSCPGDCAGPVPTLVHVLYWFQRRRAPCVTVCYSVARDEKESSGQ